MDMPKISAVSVWLMKRYLSLVSITKKLYPKSKIIAPHGGFCIAPQNNVHVHCRVGILSERRKESAQPAALEGSVFCQSESPPQSAGKLRLQDYACKKTRCFRPIGLGRNRFSHLRHQVHVIQHHPILDDLPFGAAVEIHHAQR